MMSILTLGVALVRTAWHRHHLAAVLLDLNDHYLRDMGLEREMIDAYVAEAFPWPSLEKPPARRIAVSLQGCG